MHAKPDLRSGAPGAEGPLLGRRTVFIAASAVIAGTIYLVLAHPSRLSFPAALLAGLIVVVGAAPSAAYARAATAEPFPLLPMVGWFYALFFGVTSLLLDLGWPPGKPLRLYDLWVVETIQPSTLMLILAGTVLLITGLTIGRRRLFIDLPYWRLNLPQPSSRVRMLAWLMLLLRLVLLYVPEVRTLPSVGQLIEPAGLIAYGIFYYLWQKSQTPRLEAVVVFAIVMPVDLFYTWTKGGLADLFVPLLFLTVIHLQATRRLPWGRLVSAALIFLVMYNINTTYRELTWHKNDPDQYRGETALDRAKLLVQLFGDYALGTGIVSSRVYTATKESPADVLGPFVRRTALAVPTEKLMQATPAEVPYWGGESYRSLLTSFIPRAIWPNKPTETVGALVAERYGLQFSKEVPTAVNLPWLTELYVNFGGAGIVIGMTVIGLVLAFLDRLFNRPEMTPLEAIVGSALIFRLFYQESNFTVMTGSILPLAVFFWIYFRVGLALPWPGGQGVVPAGKSRP